PAVTPVRRVFLVGGLHSARFLRIRMHRRPRPRPPTLWQLLVDLQANSISLRDAYRLTRAHVRAAQRRRVTHKTKGSTP
ncbi:MAG: hypothetical protein RXR52_35290, partial [Paraburkholderia sp.]|uniref:hypothetical protein n=1 Tax=Paraburkholderia sp. TaxID=1926495 RepID=UPI00397DBE8C